MEFGQRKKDIHIQRTCQWDVNNAGTTAIATKFNCGCDINTFDDRDRCGKDRCCIDQTCDCHKRKGGTQ
jgi:hypothetical protein